MVLASGAFPGHSRRVTRALRYPTSGWKYGEYEVKPAKRSKKSMGFILAFCGILAVSGAVLAQKPDPPPKKGKDRPALIRDDQTQETPSSEEPTDIQPDPLKARKNFEIGLYYARQGRYDAALIRFRQAILFKPDFADAKWKFLEMLGKKKDWQNLLDFSTSYLQDANMAPYRKQLSALQAKAQKELAKGPRKPASDGAKPVDPAIP